MNFFKKLSKKSFGAGFTLIELLVVISIMVIVTSVVIYNYSKFNSTTLVTNYAYEVAFAIREAQVYGLSVVNNNVGGSQNFNLGYGIHFDSNATTIGATGSAFFTLFGDIPANPATTIVGDRKFTQNSGCSAPYSTATCSEFVKNNSFVGNYKVAKFCVTNGSGQRCSDTGTISTLDITFLRPDPDAYIYTNADATPPITTSPNSRADIIIVSPLGNMKDVVVYSTGQISIQDVAGASATPTPSVTPSNSPTPTPTPTHTP